MKTIELFAGAGGLAIGAAQAGFHHTIVTDRDCNACETMRHNVDRKIHVARGWRVVEADISELDFKPYHNKVDVVMGGPPCQPFSIGGKHRGHLDERNMFPEAVRAIREIRPKAFVIENVRGLLRPSFENYFSYILLQLRYPTMARCPDEPWESHLARLEKRETGNRFRGLQYRLVTRHYNAANFGVPQRRERVFIVGIRSDLGVEFSFPDETHNQDALLHAQWVSGDYWDEHELTPPSRDTLPKRLASRVDRLQLFPREMLGARWQTVRDAIGSLPVLAPGEECTVFPNHYLNPGARAYKGHDGSGLDTPSKTLKAGDHGVPGGENTVRLDDGSLRYYSVRECARLQTFPDEWVLRGSWTECMRQLGNAVPVLLAQVVSETLIETLKGTSSNRRIRNTESRACLASTR